MRLSLLALIDAIPVRCVRPLRVKNPRFRGDPRSFKVRFNALMYPEDYRENYYMDVPCGKCYLCRKHKANAWRIRLYEECSNTPTFIYEGKRVYRAIFVCFTFDDDHLPTPESRENVATTIRKWRDLWRKKFGKSPRYFCTTDKGTQYGRLHLHLIIFNPYDYKKNRELSIVDLEKCGFFWRNGMVRYPSWLESEKGISYVTGYLTGSNLERNAIKHNLPMCKEAREHIPFIFVSNGLGSSMLEKYEKYVPRKILYEGEYRTMSPLKVVKYKVKTKRFVLDPATGNYLYRIGGYDYGLPTYYRYKLLPYFFRWHQNLCFKYEVATYKLRDSETYQYKVSNLLYDYDSLRTFYNSAFRKYDKDENKYIKLL